jgi:hypothetical protein
VQHRKAPGKGFPKQCRAPLCALPFRRKAGFRVSPGQLQGGQGRESVGGARALGEGKGNRQHRKALGKGFPKQCRAPLCALPFRRKAGLGFHACSCRAGRAGQAWAGRVLQGARMQASGGAKAGAAAPGRRRPDGAGAVGIAVPWTGVACRGKSCVEAQARPTPFYRPLGSRTENLY